MVFEDTSLTYGELDARANQLAHHLRALGVGPEVVVGLCVERSLEMLVGLLGILKAGGAYLPLDPDYPPERLAFMLADAGAPVLVTQSALRDRLPLHNARDRAARCRLARHRARSPPPHRQPSCTRNTPPTSSTPRAPPEPRRASPSRISSVSNLSCAQMADYSDAAAAIACSRIASLSFDASIWEICCRCCIGALRRADGRRAMQRAGDVLAHLIARHGVNHAAIRRRRCWLQCSKPTPRTVRCIETLSRRRRGAARRL